MSTQGRPLHRVTAVPVGAKDRPSAWCRRPPDPSQQVLRQVGGPQAAHTDMLGSARSGISGSGPVVVALLSRLGQEWNLQDGAARTFVTATQGLCQEPRWLGEQTADRKRVHRALAPCPTHKWTGGITASAWVPPVDEPWVGLPHFLQSLVGGTTSGLLAVSWDSVRCRYPHSSAVREGAVLPWTGGGVGTGAHPLV